MKTGLNYNDLIEQYRGGLLSPEDRLHVDTLLKTNVEFQNEFMLHEQVDQAILDTDMYGFEKQLSQIHTNYTKKQSSKVVWRIAASVAFLFIVGGTLWMFVPGFINSGQNLADRYYEVYQPLSAFRSGDQPTDILLTGAFEVFSNKDYANAAIKFKELLNLNPSNNMARFYLGISLIETGKTSNAIPLLQEIVYRKDVLFENQAEWYLSLCYLKTNEKAEASKHLKILVNKNSHYANQANAILKELN